MISRTLKLPAQQSFFLFGPRQVGKSTLIRATFPEESSMTYNLLRTDEYMRLKASPTLFREEVLARLPEITHIIIDEVQRIPELLNEVHHILESPNPPFFVLTGSSARKLKRSHANMLGGRALTYKLFPFTHQEISDSFHLQKALAKGTLPKIWLEPTAIVADQLLKSYVETYIKEEIEAEAVLRSTGPFLRFLTQSGFENGNLINYSSIARETGTSHTTIKEYYKILEDTLLGYFLFPYHRSTRKRLSQHPKFYYFDTGVQRAITKRLNAELLPHTPEFGNLFEQWVISETVRISEYYQKDFIFSYIRTESGLEVDLVIETPNQLTIAVEIKSQEEPSLGRIKQAMTLLGDATSVTQLCVCLAPRKRISGDLIVMPWRDYFEWLITLT